MLLYWRHSTHCVLGSSASRGEGGGTLRCDCSHSAERVVVCGGGSRGLVGSKPCTHWKLDLRHSKGQQVNTPSICQVWGLLSRGAEVAFIIFHQSSQVAVIHFSSVHIYSPYQTNAKLLIPQTTRKKYENTKYHSIHTTSTKTPTLNPILDNSTHLINQHHLSHDHEPSDSACTKYQRKPQEHKLIAHPIPRGHTMKSQSIELADHQPSHRQPALYTRARSTVELGQHVDCEIRDPNQRAHTDADD